MELDNINIFLPITEMSIRGVPDSIIDLSRENLLQLLKEKYPDLQPDEVTLENFRAVTWEDSSLGYPKEGHYYLEVLTPGYELNFRFRDHLYSVHTNANGIECAIAKICE